MTRSTRVLARAAMALAGLAAPTMHAAQETPAPRLAPGFAELRSAGSFVLFGGMAADGRPLSDTWTCSRGGWSRVEGAGPPARGSHALARFGDDDVVLFGGLGEDGRLADTWHFDGAVWAPVSTSGPPARATHAMAYDRVRRRVVLFGGSDGQDLLGDTWEWDGRRWNPAARGGPAPRRNHTLAYDPARGAVVLFGGGGANGRLSDTWTWDGVRWREVPTPAPPARDHHASTYHRGLGGTLVYGGWDGSYRGDLWVWSGAWTLQAEGGPERAGRPGLVVSASGRLLLYGGGGPDGPEGALLAFADGSWSTTQNCG